MASSRKSPLADRAAAHLTSLVPPSSRLLAGLSGGLDSVVLLHLLHELAPRAGWRLSALHVHHGISPNADAWADFCAALCARLNVPLHIEKVDIAPLRDEHGIEAAARKLRHAAFARQDCDFVALAHHADDQVETLLLQLLRGAGVKGAAAMPVLSKVEGPVGGYLENKQVIRPLLDSLRADLLAYARQQGLAWVEDESNADDRYPRNFLRHRILPLLEERFPACRETLARSAAHFAEAAQLLDELARLDAAAPAGGGEGLEVARLQSLSLPRAKNLLRHFLHMQGAPMPQAAQLDDLLRQLCRARQDAAVCVAFGDWQVRRYQGRAYAMPVLPDFDPALELSWCGEAQLFWPPFGRMLEFTPATGAGIGFAHLQAAPVTLRLRCGGERLRPHPVAATRTLKHLLQEREVPPWQRERLPLLYCGEELAAIVGVAVAAGFQAGSGEAGIVAA